MKGLSLKAFCHQPTASGLQGLLEELTKSKREASVTPGVCLGACMMKMCPPRWEPGCTGLGEHSAEVWTVLTAWDAIHSRGWGLLFQGYKELTVLVMS